MARLLPLSSWNRVPVGRIEDLSDAVHGAGLRATQMTRGEVSGGIAFADLGGMVFTSGLIEGRVALAGPLSQSGVTIGIGLDLPPGTQHWLTEVRAGEVAIFHGGDEHDSLYQPGSLYAAVTFPAEALEAEAAERGFVLDRKCSGARGSTPAGSHPRSRRPFAPPSEGSTAGARSLLTWAPRAPCWTC